MQQIFAIVEEKLLQEGSMTSFEGNPDHVILNALWTLALVKKLVFTLLK